jgi:hypothetical protein
VDVVDGIGQVQDPLFDAFLNSIEVGTKKPIPLIGFESYNSDALFYVKFLVFLHQSFLFYSQYCQFVVESEEFPVNSFPLIIYDSSGN